MLLLTETRCGLLETKDAVMTTPLSLAQRPGQSFASVARLPETDGLGPSENQTIDPIADHSGNAIVGLAWATALSVPLWVGIGFLVRTLVGGA